MRRSPLPLVTTRLVLPAFLACAWSAAWGCRPGDAPGTEPTVPAGSGATTADAGDVRPDSALPRVSLQPLWSRLTFDRPVFATPAGDGTDRLFIVEQGGTIRVAATARETAAKPVFLDITPKVHRGHNEEGLLTLAFHPRYAENGRFYVYYSAKDPRRTVLAAYTVSDTDPDRADPDSEQAILVLDQPWGNHNGATILFGPDGMLYLSIGDGGSANDPRGSGQDLSTLLGTVIRIDVDRPADGRPFGVPEDNPFVGRTDARPEIWAYGFRNVWRMSFDRETGELWGGDLGQNRWEEIDLIVRGGNYGWNLREGAHEFRGSGGRDDLIDPVIEYPRSEGLSVIGGYVYRGTRLPALVGAYVYADYVTGKIWALRHENGGVIDSRQIGGGRRRHHVTSFGEDADGELLACCFDRLDGRKGRVYRVVGQ